MLSNIALLLAAQLASGPASYVDPLIGTANGGNTFPGAVVPFGMVQWSPENTRGDATRTPAPGGYQYDATRIRGFSLTHLSGTGCAGASGDVPFMPLVGSVTTAPPVDTTNRTYATSFSHVNETAEAGYYQVRLSSGINVELAATTRTGSGRFRFPASRPATMLVRASDSEVGSSDARVDIDAANRTVSGSVSSGNFCGYINEVDRRSYYTLHFVAVFDQPFASVGTWEDAVLKPGATDASGGTGWGPDGYPAKEKGSGAFIAFDTTQSSLVQIRVGISYVSIDNARANLQAENPAGTSFDALRQRAREAWNRHLSRILIEGGTESERKIFYTALYHSLLHPNIFSDVNGQYWGFDQRVHTISGQQKFQYATFSGWDVYRSQVQLVTLLDPEIASDIAQSLLNQANQNNGVWDRWTHNSGPTYVMAGDPSAPAVAGIYAFGGTGFDVKGALSSLLKAATVPTPLDLSNKGCRVECMGQRPSLDKWLSINYIPTVSNSWGGAGETLEDVTADFSLSQLALRLGDSKTHDEFLKRAQYWKNVFNPKATPEGGYIQNRNEDGSWPEFNPGSSTGFAEGSSAQYTWMIPFNAAGLIEAMGGKDKANSRLDSFFHTPDGSWALTGLGSLYAEMNNEPSIGAAWMYLFTGKPYKSHETIRQVLKTLWSDRPHGIPGNDDLGAMSSWYVWSAIGMYPGIPGRAELLLSAPLFPRISIQRGNGKTISIRAPEAAMGVPYIQSLRVNGQMSNRSWLPEMFVSGGGRLDFVLSRTANPSWASSSQDTPPSFKPAQ